MPDRALAGLVRIMRYSALRASLEQADDEVAGDEEHDEHDGGESRPEAVLALREGLEDLGVDHLGGVARPAIGQGIDDVEDAQAIEDVEHGDDDNGGHQHGQRHVPQPRPEAGAVDLGGLVVVSAEWSEGRREG